MFIVSRFLQFFFGRFAAFVVCLEASDGQLKTWQDAQDYCEATYPLGNLPSIRNQAELDIVFEAYAGMCARYYTVFFFVPGGPPPFLFYHSLGPLWRFSC